MISNAAVLIGQYITFLLALFVPAVVLIDQHITFLLALFVPQLTPFLLPLNFRKDNRGKAAASTDPLHVICSMLCARHSRLLQISLRGTLN